MAFEGYRFLRYFIPGSLYVIYMILLVAPNLTVSLLEILSKQPELLLGIFGGAFVASPALGYVIYTFYDSILYNRLAMRDWRPILPYMRNRVNTWEERSKEERKEFLDLLYFCGNHDAMNKDFAGTIRGIWSHFNARVVCSFFVPVFCFCSLLILYLIEGYSSVEIFNFRMLYLWVSLGIIIFVSLVLVWGSRRPYREATRLEYNFLITKIEDEGGENTDRFRQLATRLLEATFDQGCAAR